MARITNPTRELIEDHTPEEVLAYLAERFRANRISTIKGMQDQNIATLTSALMEREYLGDILVELNKKVNKVDDSPAIVA